MIFLTLKPPPTYKLPQMKLRPQKIYSKNFFLNKKQYLNNFKVF